MQRTLIAVCFITLVAIISTVFLSSTAPGPAADSVDESAATVPSLQFTGFDEMNGVPIATMELTNGTDLPIYFAGYGPDRPLQTWERQVDNLWVHCDYEWCGTGRSTYSLAPGVSITIATALREFRTPDMPDDPPLSSYTKPMRVVLYYGHSEDDIAHAVHGESFKPQETVP